VRYAWIRDRRDHYPVALTCRVLGVSRAGYYAWQRRLARAEPGRRRKRREELAGQVRAVHEASRRTYGSPRVYQELKAREVACCENTVARVMRDAGIRSVVRRRFRARTTDSTHAHPVAPNVLARDFAAAAPDRKWAADITYVPTGEGWLYLGVVIDLCSRKVVGWSMGESLRAELCTDALAMAVRSRRPPPGAGLIHHSDRGVQYACGLYRRLLESNGIVCSMSGKGDCYDNAVAESFFKTLKVELVYQQPRRPGGFDGYATRAEARRSVFEYIEVFYNRKRLHSSLGYVSPEQFEADLAGVSVAERKDGGCAAGGVVASPPRKTPDAAEKVGGLLLCGGNKTSAH
jgi:putative transposase